MKHALGLLGVAAAAVLLLVSAAMNWQFGYQLGKTEFDSTVLGLASAASDCLKALLPFFLFAAIKDRKWSVALASGTLWVVTLAFSLTSALGFASLNRSDTTGARAAQVQSYKDVRVELDRLRERLNWIPEHRPAAAVAADIEGIKQNRRWSATGGCTNATASKSIEFCQSYYKLGAEHVAAVEASQIETQIAALKSQLAAAPADFAETKADPQAETLSFLSGHTIEAVQIGLVILVAILVELGSSLGFYVALGQWRIYDQRPAVVVARPRTKEGANDNASGLLDALPQVAAVPQIAQRATAAANTAAPLAVETKVAPQKLLAPENDIERFYKERVGQAEGCSLTATALYEDYCDWCEELSKEPLALPTFGRQFGELGVHKAKIAGRIRYIGIRLNSGRADEEVAPLVEPKLAVG
ncbi:MAG: hypothetical protein GC150_05235 [Rhizobiales bacterium]|nr:hypothetical protein [Hyphomicrobiales bacterium]